MELSERYIKQLESEDFARVYEDDDAPGAVYDTHSHHGRVTLWITDGSMTFTMNGEEKEYVAGDRIDIAPGVEHSCVVGPEGAIYIVAEEIISDA